MKKINELFFLRPWAVKEDILQIMAEIVQRHLRGEKLTTEEIEAVTKQSNKKDDVNYEVIDGVAHIPIYGIISKRMGLVRSISQPAGTSIQEIRKNLKAALDDKEVNTILLDIDSPGGSVDGVDELSDFIYESRGAKSIIAYANGMMASAAYYIGSAADQVYASKSSEVGSIGVFAVLRDFSVMEHNEGIKTQIIKAGKYKAAGHSSMPLAEDAKQVIQEEVDYYYELFVEAVARNRGITSEQTLTLADGKVYIGKKAVQAGLVDGLRNFESFFATQQTKESKNFSSTASPAGGSDDIDVGKERAITNQQKEAGMDITLEKLKAENKDIVDALISEGKETGIKQGKELGIKEGKESGVKEERERATQIFASMPQGMTDVAIQAVKEGKTSEQAKDMFLAEMKKEAPPSPGPGGDAETNKNDADKNLSVEDCCKKEWEKNPKLQQEFASLETYTGYRKGIEKGYIKDSRR